MTEFLNLLLPWKDAPNDQISDLQKIANLQRAIEKDGRRTTRAKPAVLVQFLKTLHLDFKFR